MSIDIPLFLDGELRYVKFFEEDGIAQRQTFNFPILGDVFLYPYPHPEQVTMPRYLKLRQVTNKGSVLPPAYYDLIKDCCRLGLNSNLAIDVKGIPVIPYDFAVSYILQQREKILKETGFGRQRGCCSVVAKGKRHGKYKEYRFHMASKSQALGEGTGIPAAMGAILMNRGKVNGHGVMPPEACIEPGAFLGLMPEVMEWGVKKTEGESFSGYIVESVDELGNVTRMELP
jgi:saccharopine dehydrogenase (NAD+, L-lysine-forming)